MSALLQSLREEASSNMRAISVAADTFHELRSLSKEEALANIHSMSRTADVSHEPMSLSKDEAPRNM